MENYNRYSEFSDGLKRPGPGNDRSTCVELLRFEKVKHLRDWARDTVLWKSIEPYLPDFKGTTTNNRTVDQIVGLTLHCFILSLVVLIAVLVKGTISLVKFVCFVALNFVVYRGDVTPIADNTNEPITEEQLKDATVFEFPGLKVIIVQNRLVPNKSYKAPPLLSPQLRTSRSSSSQDLSHIFSSSLNCQ